LVNPLLFRTVELFAVFFPLFGVGTLVCGLFGRFDDWFGVKFVIDDLQIMFFMLFIKFSLLQFFDVLFWL
jgi:hypothetical protein